MSKGEETKEEIKLAAELLTDRGMLARRFQTSCVSPDYKGVYNHFKSKDELACQAFDYASHLHQSAL